MDLKLGILMAMRICVTSLVADQKQSRPGSGSNGNAYMRHQSSGRSKIKQTRVRFSANPGWPKIVHITDNQSPCEQNLFVPRVGVLTLVSYQPGGFV